MSKYICLVYMMMLKFIIYCERSSMESESLGHRFQLNIKLTCSL